MYCSAQRVNYVQLTFCLADPQRRHLVYFILRILFGWVRGLKFLHV